MVASRDVLTAGLSAVEKAAMTDCESASMKAASWDPQQAADWVGLMVACWVGVMAVCWVGLMAAYWAADWADQKAENWADSMDALTADLSDLSNKLQMPQATIAVLDRGRMTSSQHWPQTCSEHSLRKHQHRLKKCGRQRIGHRYEQ